MEKVIAKYLTRMKRLCMDIIKQEGAEITGKYYYNTLQ